MNILTGLNSSFNQKAKEVTQCITSEWHDIFRF